MSGDVTSYAMEYITASGYRYVVGTHSTSGVANFLLFIKLIYTNLSVISFIGRGVYSFLQVME